jgi:hypothetical protein
MFWWEAEVLGLMAVGDQGELVYVNLLKAERYADRRFVRMGKLTVKRRDQLDESV